MTPELILEQPTAAAIDPLDAICHRAATFTVDPDDPFALNRWLRSLSGDELEVALQAVLAGVHQRSAARDAANGVVDTPEAESPDERALWHDPDGVNVPLYRMSEGDLKR